MRINILSYGIRIFNVLDLDTGKYIDDVIWMDDETGEYELYHWSEKEHWMIHETKKGNIILVWTGRDNGIN